MLDIFTYSFVLQVDFQTLPMFQYVLMMLYLLAVYHSTVAGEVSVPFALCVFTDACFFMVWNGLAEVNTVTSLVKMHKFLSSFLWLLNK